MADDDLRGERAGDHPAALLELDNVAAVAEHRPPANRSVAAAFDEQIEAQQGVDFWIGETFFQLGEAELCLRRIKPNSERPAMITVAFRATNTTEDGFSAAECAKRLSDAGAEIVGVNCMRDPERTYPIIADMRAASDGYLAAQPVAYRTSDTVPCFTATPAFPDRLEPTRLTRFEMADFALRARDMGVDYIGSCCGSGAQHVSEMARVLGKYRDTQRWTPDPSRPMSETERNWDRIGFDERSGGRRRLIDRPLNFTQPAPALPQP